MMPFGKDRQFEREAAGKGTKKKVAVVFRHEARTVGAFGMENVAEKTPLLGNEMFAGADELSFDERRNERKRDELRVGMSERGATARADILEDINMLKAVIPVEVEDPFAITGKNLRDRGDRQFFHRKFAVG